jgi:hypothetical protein
LELGALPHARHLSPATRHSAYFRLSSLRSTTDPENLNLGGGSNCTIYAIYFHFSGVGRGSDRKNSLKIRITQQMLIIIAIVTTAVTPKTADLLGNWKICENWTASDRKFRRERQG